MSLAKGLRGTRDRLDPAGIFGSPDYLEEESLRRTLILYLRCCHRSRLHLSLDKDSPDSRVPPIHKGADPLQAKSKNVVG
jgi:hypothetical protein